MSGSVNQQAVPAPAGAGSQPLALRHTAQQALRLLALLRTFAPIAQVFTLWIATGQFGVEVPMSTIGLILAIEIAVALATWVRLRMALPVSDTELFLQAQIDIAAFGAVLFYTGGASNPFAPLFVLPMVIVASALSPRWVWMTALTTIVWYTYLRSHHVPMFHPEGQTEVYELHEDGMVVNYVFTSLLLSFFVSHMFSETRRHQRVVAELRDAQMRDESVVNLGALAAGYAHELSTPLATMAVVASELRRERAGDEPLQAELRVIDEQIQACKTIVSNLAAAGGRQRAEAAGAARADEFVTAIVTRVRALNPDATIALALDSATPAPTIVAEETLRQTISNLLQNAARASPSDVQVRVDWGGDELRVTVTDRGPGFSPEVLEQIGRQVVTARRPGSGMGIGLMLGMVTLDRLGGKLELSNRPDGGACAVARVPLQRIQIGNLRRTTS